MTPRTWTRGWSAMCLLALAACAPASPAPSSPPVPSAPSVNAPSPTAIASPDPTTHPGPSRPPATTPPPPTPSTSLPIPSQAEPRTVTINFSGDLLWHDTLWESARIDGGGAMDFGPQLAAVAEAVGAADVAICHSEVPFAAAGGPYSDYPMFKAPQEIAGALAQIGWDVCTTASNHSLDAGLEGLRRTIQVHAAHGILTAGTFASAADRETPVVLTTTEGVRVAVVSSTYGTNGIPLPEDAPWSVSLMDVTDTLAQAARARAAGADVVVVHLHAGTEYEASPNQQQVEFAEALTASDDVDLVIGQHAHVVQPVTRMHGKWVAYGAGNLIAQSGPAQPWTYDGYLATFEFVEQRDGSFSSSSGEFAPTMITKYRSGSPARVLVVSDALASGAWDGKQLRESAARTRETVLSLGVQGLREH